MLNLIRACHFPFEANELEKWVKEFDLLSFIYIVKYPRLGGFPHWYPCSIYYFEYSTLDLISFIKSIPEYRRPLARDLFEMGESEFMEFLKGPVNDAITKIIRDSPGFGLRNPLKALLDKDV